MNKEKSIFGWLTIDMIIFSLEILAVIIFYGDRLSVLGSMGFFEILLFGLATYRVANIISTEKITKPLRAPFVDEVEENGKTVEKPKTSGWAGATGYLIHCPACTGVWVATTFVSLYIFLPNAAYFLGFIFALSAVERIIAHVSLHLKRE